MKRLRRLWFRALQRWRCFRGHHRETLVAVYGELRLVCLECPWARTIGRVCQHGSNLRRDPRWLPDDA